MTQAVNNKAASPSAYFSSGSKPTPANTSPATSSETNTFDPNSGWKLLRTEPLPQKPQATLLDLAAGIRISKYWLHNRNNTLRDLSYTQAVFDDDDDDDKLYPPVNDATGEFRIKESWLLPTGAHQGAASRLQTARLDEIDTLIEQRANGPIEEYEEDDSLGTEAFEVASLRVDPWRPEWYVKHLDWLLSAALEDFDRAVERSARQGPYEEDDSKGTEAFDDPREWPGQAAAEQRWRCSEWCERVDWALEQKAASEACYEEGDSRGIPAFD